MRTLRAMEKINVADLPWDGGPSPKGTYHSYSKEISKALGAGHNAWPKSGHPFDLSLVRVPPGKSVCPFHSHTAQHELFVIISGEGTVRAGDARHIVKSGDAFMHPPGEAHQIINTGTEDLLFYVIADNPPVDISHYPDSGKWGLRPHGKFFRMNETGYFDGEE
jgi:mannose-6-phosphate isomerase-like protein (cupin superfamily)